MQNLPATFDRSFQMWHYVVSHAQLLLRSPKSVEHPTNIDIAFSGVSAVILHSQYNTITVRRCDDTEEGIVFPDLSRHPADTIFVLGGGKVIGFVLCSNMKITEDHKDFWDVGLDLPGMFMPRWVEPASEV